MPQNQKKNLKSSISSKIKILTVIYIFVIIGIVVIANVKSTQYLLRVGSGGIPYFDKLGHFFLMGIFSFLVNLTLRARTILLWKFRYLLGSLIVLIVVSIEEFSQIFVSGRAFDLGDLVADFFGIMLFGELARFIYGRYLVK